MADRDEMVRGLRALADFLESHEDIPVYIIRASEPVDDGTDEENCAEVDRIAAILEREPKPNDIRSHYGVSRDFGGSVVYEATAITRGHMAAWSEHMKKFDDEQREEQPNA